jgi:hypothetical protein
VNEIDLYADLEAALMEDAAEEDAVDEDAAAAAAEDAADEDAAAAAAEDAAVSPSLAGAAASEDAQSRRHPLAGTTPGDTAHSQQRPSWPAATVLPPAPLPASVVALVDALSAAFFVRGPRARLRALQCALKRGS